LKTTHFQQQKRTHSSKSSRKLSVIWKIKYIAIEEDSLTLSVELSYRPGCQKVLLLLSHSEKHESQVNQTYIYAAPKALFGEGCPSMIAMSPEEHLTVYYSRCSFKQLLFIHLRYFGKFVCF